MVPNPAVGSISLRTPGKSIEVGVHVGRSDNGSGKDIGRDGCGGCSIAAIAERDPAARHAGDPVDDRQASVRFTESPCPGEFDGCIELRQELLQLAPQNCGLAGEQCIALLFVRESFIFPTAEDASFPRRPNIEIRTGGLPDTALTRPQILPRLAHGRDCPGGCSPVMPTWHAVGKLISGRKDKVGAMNASPVRQRRGHTARLRRDVGDVQRRKNPRAGGDGGIQQRERGLPWIDDKVVVAHQRRDPCHSKPVVQLPATQKSTRQSARPARLVLASKSSGAELIAGEVEGIPSRDVGEPKLAKPRCERFHCQARPAPGAYGRLHADLARELDQRRIDFVLHQRGACQGRTFRKAALVDDGDLQPGRRQRIGDKCAGEAGTYHQHVSLVILGQARARDSGRGATLPDRAAASQVL